MAPASTGSESNSRNAVTRIDQTKSGILCSVMPGARILKMVVMKLIAPRIEEVARQVDRQDREVHGEDRACPWWRAARRGSSLCRCHGRQEARERKAISGAARKEAGSSQNEMLFMRGKAMSGAPIINGTIQLPNPPIMAGMIVKNIMVRP